MIFARIIYSLIGAVIIGGLVEWRQKSAPTQKKSLKKAGFIAYWYIVPSLALMAFFGLALHLALFFLIGSSSLTLVKPIFYILLLAVLWWSPMTAQLLDWQTVRSSSKNITAYLVLMELWVLSWLFAFTRFEPYWYIGFFLWQLTFILPFLLPKNRWLNLAAIMLVAWLFLFFYGPVLHEVVFYHSTALVPRFN